MTGFWTNRPVLVTGASGLLGGWLVQRLIEQEADIVCLMRDWVPLSELESRKLTQSVKLVQGDVCDQAMIERVLAEYEIDTVFHLAAQTIVGVANSNPAATFETNVRGTWVVLEACRRASTVKQILVASSDKAYGEQEQLPYTEETRLQGQHPYAVSKSCTDLISQTYSTSYGLPVAITRCGNFYGGGDLNWNRIVPGTIRSALQGKRPVIRSDGQSERDYLYVEDGVSAYMTLAESLAADRAIGGQAFNFGHNVPVKVLDLVRAVLRHCGREDLEPEVRGEATNEIPSQYLDASKAGRALGWKPEFALDQGLERTVTWYKKFFNA